MPNAHDYRVAALHLRRLAGEIDHAVRLVGRAADPEDLAGGPLAAALRDGIDAHRRSVERACDELHRLAAVCDRRAEICVGYVADLRRHRVLVEAGTTWIRPPAPPAWWVTP